jgi:hypothetical protein
MTKELTIMVDRRIRYINPNGRIPPPGGGNQLLEELKAPALSDLQKERLLAMRSLTVEERPVVAAVESTPGMSAQMFPGDSKNESNTQPEPASLIEDQEERALLEDSEPQDEVWFSDGDGPKGIAGHSGLVLTFERVEALRPVRADSREKTVNALRQLAESVSSGDMPWELLQADFDGKTGLAEHSGASGRFPGSRETGSRHTDQSDQFAEIVVPLAEGMVRGRALVACPGWFLLMLLFLAASGLALIAEQGFLRAGLFTHFLDSKPWTFIKLALIFLAALVALRGFFFSLFTKPYRNSRAKAL